MHKHQTTRLNMSNLKQFDKIHTVYKVNVLRHIPKLYMQIPKVMLSVGIFKIISSYLY